MYAYVGGDPVNMRDPDGMRRRPDQDTCVPDPDGQGVTCGTTDQSMTWEEIQAVIDYYSNNGIIAIATPDGIEIVGGISDSADDEQQENKCNQRLVRVGNMLRRSATLSNAVAGTGFGLTAPASGFGKLTGASPTPLGRSVGGSLRSTTGAYAIWGTVTDFAGGGLQSLGTSDSTPIKDVASSYAADKLLDKYTGKGAANVLYNAFSNSEAVYNSFVAETDVSCKN